MAGLAVQLDAGLPRVAVDPLALQPGDHVVHSQHGIARFVELQRRKVTGGPRTAPGAEESYREYLVLEYAPSKRGAPGDRLLDRKSVV